MRSFRKNTILLFASAMAFILFLGFTIAGFIISSNTGSLNITGNDKIICAQAEEDNVYVTTNDNKLNNYENGELVWSKDILDRSSDVVITSNQIIIGYVSERKVDVFSKETGEKLTTITVPYQILSIDADQQKLYIAAKKGGLNGSVIYCYPEYLQNSEKVSISSSNVITDIAIHPVSKALYGLSTDYNVYVYEHNGNQIVSNLFSSIRFEPLALGFVNNQLVVADTVGTISFFSDNQIVKTVNTGMTLCSFACRNDTNFIVCANISGKGAVVDAQSGKTTKIDCPTEVQKITISDKGIISFSEYRSFKTQYYDYEKIGGLLFFGWSKYVGLALTVIALALLIISIFASNKQREKALLHRLSRIKIGLKKSWKSYTFILPTFVLLIMFMYVPAVWGLVLSFFDYVPGVYTRPVGFENFIAVMKDPFFTGGIGNMLIFLVTDLVKALIPALFIAELILALNSKRAQYWVRALIYIPGILPGVAVLLIWTKGIYGEMGLLNSIVQLFGSSGVDWLGNENTALGALVFIGLPWVGQYILFYGALMSIPESYKESAKLDGCTWLKSIIYIDIPMIIPQLKYVFIITFINSIQDFGRVYMTTGQISATNIPSLQMYMTLNSGSGYGRAAAMGMLLFIVVFGATLFNMKAQKTESNF